MQLLRLPRRTAANAANSNVQESSSPPVLAAVAAALISVQSSLVVTDVAFADSTPSLESTDAVEVISDIASTEATTGKGFTYLKPILLPNVP